METTPPNAHKKKNIPTTIRPPPLAVRCEEGEVSSSRFFAFCSCFKLFLLFQWFLQVFLAGVLAFWFHFGFLWFFFVLLCFSCVLVGFTLYSLVLLMFSLVCLGFR